MQGRRIDAVNSDCLPTARTMKQDQAAQGCSKKAQSEAVHRSDLREFCGEVGGLGLAIPPGGVDLFHLFGRKAIMRLIFRTSESTASMMKCRLPAFSGDQRGSWLWEPGCGRSLSLVLLVFCVLCGNTTFGPSADQKTAGLTKICSPRVVLNRVRLKSFSRTG
jgi:hypothetical protein